MHVGDIGLNIPINLQEFGQYLKKNHKSLRNIMSYLIGIIVSHLVVPKMMYLNVRWLNSKMI